jgi:hypothetical protein
MGVDEARSDQPATGVDTMECVERQPFGRDLAVDVLGSAGGQDPPVPRRDGE